jgi:putative ABC transport system permease protein
MSLQIPVLWTASRRHLLRHPWICALSVAGVALGVAVVVATELASRSAQVSFDLAAEAVTGRATHQIVGGPAGVPEQLYVRLRTEHGLRDSAPVVEGTALLGEPRRAMTLLGVDLFAERPFRSYAGASLGSGDEGLGRFLAGDGALLSASTAAALDLRAGGPLEVVAGGRRQELTLVGTFSVGDGPGEGAAENLVLVDLATAQELLGLAGRLSRIELRLDAAEPSDVAERLAGIGALLPDGIRLERSSSRTETADELTRAFRLNLFTLSLLALLCGAFLIYNSVTFSVVMRRGVFGILRALGTTRAGLLRLVLAETLVVGLAGSVLGGLFGRLLAHGLIEMVARTISDHYFEVAVRSPPLGAAGMATGFGLGLVASVAAGLRPAWEAARVAPRAAMLRSELERGSRRMAGATALAGGGSILLGALVMAICDRALWPSFAAVLAVLLGCALLTPAAVRVAGRLLAAPLGAVTGSIGRLAARGLTGHLSRTGVAIAALMLALSVTIGIGLMISSFRLTVERWLSASLPADLYLMSPSAASDGSGTTHVRPEWIEAVAGVPGVERINLLRAATVDSSAGRVDLVALDMDERSHRAFALRAGDEEAVWRAYHRGDGILVSEPLAYHAGIGVGTRLAIETPRGEVALEVAGVFYDYSSDRGYVLIDLARYRSLFGDPGLTAASLYVADGSRLDRVADSVRAALPAEAALTVTTQAALRERSLEIFDRTFRVTGVLRTVTLLVAVIGIVSALMAQQLERTRELGLLRATGLTRRQLWLTVTAQTGLIGLVAGLLALPVGVAMAAMTTRVINRRSFGWTIPLEIEPSILWQALAAAVLSALVAGVLPALRMAQTSPAEALRAE